MLDKLRAIALRDWLTAVRYHTGLWMQALGVLAEIVAFYYLASAIGPGFRPDGISYFSFVLIGTAVYGFVTTGAYGIVSSIQAAQTTGTMEILMTTSTPPSALVSLSAVSAFGSRIASFCGYLAVGMLLARGDFEHANWIAAMTVLALTLVMAIGVGLVGASLQIAIQKGLGIVQTIAAFGWFVSGTLFPISALPRPLRIVAALNPLVYSLDGIRKALILGVPLRSLSTEFLVLAAWSVALLLAGIFGLGFTINHARRSGTLSFY